MLMNYFLTAYRSLLKNKLYTLINVLGLAVGLAGVIIISLYTKYELSYDTMYPEYDRIYRISREKVNTSTGESLHRANLAGIAAPLLKQDFAEIEEFCRIYHSSSTALVQCGELRINESNINYVDPEFFDIFKLEFIKGDPKTALVDRGSVVLTESMARKYFGNEDPIGKVLNVFRAGDVHVTGIIKDLPKNSILVGNFFISILNSNPALNRYWHLDIPHTFVKVSPGTNIEELASKFPAFLDRHAEKSEGQKDFIHPMALSDIHFHSHLAGEFKENGNIQTLYMFVAIALFILIIATINFMNLSTARASMRAREVAMRKVIGASNGQIITQFLIESILVTALGVLIATFLVEMVLPSINNFTQVSMVFEYLTDWKTTVSLILLTLMVGVIAGSYPAFYLSAYRPGKVLKGDVTRGKSGAMFRNVLVTIQFAVSIFLIICTAVVYSQLYYVKNADLGYNRNNVVHIDNIDDTGMNLDAFRQLLSESNSILHVMPSSSMPTGVYTDPVPIRIKGVEAQNLQMASLCISPSFLEGYEIELVSGRTFSWDRPADMGTVPNQNTEPITHGSFLVNESAVRALGLTKENILNREFSAAFEGDWANYMEGPVLGVVKDINFQSLHELIPPVFYYYDPSRFWDLSIKIKGDNPAEAIAFIESKWKEMAPNTPLDYNFLDDMFNATYQAETRQTVLFFSFSALAIAIACLGLFGLASYTTQRRAKEIAIRKVLGASVWSITLMLTNQFNKLVLLSNIIAWPFAYLLMQNWLSNFAYRIELSPKYFLFGGLIALIIAWVTVGLHAARAATLRPVHALRYE